MKGDGEVWRIEIPRFHPVLLNRLLKAHPLKRATLRRNDDAMIAIYCRLAGVPRARRVKRRVHLTYVKRKGQGGKTPDDDGLWKSLLDALVNAGVLYDDSPDWVETTPVKHERAAEKATIIELEDVT